MFVCGAQRELSLIVHEPRLPRCCLAGAKFVQDRELKAHTAWLKREGVKPEWRDFCSHLLMPWNRCRRAESFKSWKCHTEKHAWEECMEHE